MVYLFRRQLCRHLSAVQIFIQLFGRNLNFLQFVGSLFQFKVDGFAFAEFIFVVRVSYPM